MCGTAVETMVCSSKSDGTTRRKNKSGSLAVDRESETCSKRGERGSEEAKAGRKEGADEGWAVCGWEVVVERRGKGGLSE